MKKIVYVLLVMGLLSACSKYEEDIKTTPQSYQALTPENIDTDLKIAHLILEEEAYNEMYEKYTEEIEIDGMLSLYKNGETLLKNEEVEIKIKGGFSASLDLKTLAIKFEDAYHNEDRKLIDPDALPFHSLDRIKSFRFRNSGNDFLHTMIKDMSYTKLAIDAGLDLDLMYAEQTVVFINHTFLGIMNLRTESNAHGLSRLYGVKKGDITSAKIIESGVLDKKDGDFDRIDNFMAAIERNDFEYVHNEIDINNFIDYMIFQSYIGNRDWPKNNVRFFAIHDGPFRFVLFDLDLAATEYIERAPLLYINSRFENPITDLFNVLYADETFKQQYDARFEELIASELLSSTRFNAIVTSYKNNIEPLMPLHVVKYGAPATLVDWYLNIAQLKNNFEEREKYMKK